jgi:cysteinyl-tRNA synthetase
VTGETIEQSASRLAGLDAFARRFAAARATEPDPDAMARFRALMDDDLDTPGVMALLSDVVRNANTDADAGRNADPQAAAVFELTGVLGLELRSETGAIDDGSQALVDERDAARAARDALRDELQALGWTVEDTPEGTRIHR